MDTPTDTAFEFVKKLSLDLSGNDFDIPPFPDIALRIREALDDPDVSIEALSQIVLSEPALTARLMRMANSAMLHRGTLEITDIKTAISRVGLDMVQNAAISYATRETFKVMDNSTLREHIERTREHSIRVAALSYILAKKTSYTGKPDEAMLAGLLHAIGKFYILTRADKFPDLFADPGVLEGVLNEWHTGIGRAIIESWEFPEHIVNAVDECELLDRQGFGPADVTDIVIVANILAKTGEEQADGQPDLDELPSLSRMKADSSTIRNFVQESEDEINSMTQALNS